MINKSFRKVKNSFRLFVRGILFYFVYLLNSIGIGRLLINESVNSLMKLEKKVNHNGVELKFLTPNLTSYQRADTFSEKEPETLKWIDSMPSNSVLWDIGANVGIYSCYAAKKDCVVFSFEPSVFNLELLSRNIFINGLSDKISIVPISVSGLNDFNTFNTFNMGSTEWGGSQSTFGENIGYDGQEINKIFEYKTVGLTLDNFINYLKLPFPDYIKIDVDGIEHIILEGGECVLGRAQGVLVEVNDEYIEQAKGVDSLLTKYGFVLAEKTHSDMMKNSTTFNQIWIKC